MAQRSPDAARRAEESHRIDVIIVEDRPTDAELMVLRLQEEGLAPDWRRVETGDALTEALAVRPDLVLSDWSLPRFGGLAALEIVRAYDPDLPFIIVSGSVGEEVAIDALHRGADDYVLKDRLARLGPAVRRTLEASRLRVERRRAVDQLAFQASILASVRDAVVVTDVEGVIRYWNEGATAVFGYSAAEMVGRPLTWAAAEHGPALAAAAARTMGGAPHGMARPRPMRHKDGRELWIDVSTSMLTDHTGAVTGIISVSRDVTEHRRLELERERLATAIEQAHEAVVITDLEARIQYVNPAFERASGYLRDEVIGQNPRILQSGAHPRSFYQAMWSALTSGEAWVAEFTNRRKDGSVYQERAHISPIRGPEGAIVSYVAVKHDVTRERELEEAASRHARERALIADTLARLPAGRAVEETAEAICRQVVSLSDIAAVAVVRFDHERRAMPVAFVTADGTAQPQRPLSLARSRHLHARALEGPWVEAWVQGPPSHPYRAIHAELGTTALAEVPIRHGGDLVGMLATFSAMPDGVLRLTNTLPALAELADLTGVVLGPTLAERMSSGRLRGRIQAVIDQGAFHPVFQPIVDLQGSGVVGYEALTRFDDGARPNVVFADAWSVGLGPALELATLAAAIDGAGTLPSGGWLSVNVSPRLLEDEPGLAALLATAGRPVVVEVTEHETIADYGALRKAIRALGGDVRLAVDDAGAGAANFAHIVDLRPDFVKLDIGLVRGIDHDTGRQALVVGMRHFAQTAGCRLVAEGIETRAEADTLAELGAELGQGYLFGRPSPARHWAVSRDTVP
ncbi:MAG: PAS domain S-box protein [Chloroflexota bacterium]